MIISSASSFAIALFTPKALISFGANSFAPTPTPANDIFIKVFLITAFASSPFVKPTVAVATPVVAIDEDTFAAFEAILEVMPAPC